jgi:hypothetical protein
MATYCIKLVDHINTASTLAGLIQKDLQSLFSQVFTGTSDSAMVQWGTGAQTDAIVLHFATDIAGSYLEQKWPGQTIDPAAGGHTHYKAALKTTGSEFYMFANFSGQRAQVTAPGMARAAFHESLHNQWPGWTNADMHGPKGGGGLAAKPIGKTLTPTNIDLMRRGLSMKNAQLL